MQQRDWKRALGALAGLLVFLLAVYRPWSMDFALNDDWAYWLAARRLAAEGVLRLTDWAPATQVTHVIWGGLWAAVFGDHMGWIKVSTLLWLFLGGAFFVRLLLEEGAGLERALFAFALIALCPVTLPLALSFMSDVPYLALTMIALYAFARGLRDDAARWWWIGGLIAAAAYLSRQIGLFLLVAPAYVLWRRGRLDLSTALALGAPCAAALLGHQVWLRFFHGPTRASQMYLIHGTLSHLMDVGGFLYDAWWRTTAYLVYAGLFAGPLLAGVAVRRRALGKDDSAVPAWTHFAAAALLLSLSVLIVNRGWMPFLENTFHARGLGTMTLSEARFKAAGPFGWPGFYPALTLLGFLGGAGLLWVGGAAWKLEDRGGVRRMLLLTGLVQFAATLLGEKYFDRYTILALPGLIGGIALATRQWRFSPRAAWLAFAPLAVLTLAGEADYAAWNRAKWQLGAAAVQAGAPPERIAGGLDWDAYWSYEGTMARLKRIKPLHEIGEWEWRRLVPKAGFLAFCAPGAAPEPGWAEMGRKPFWTPFSTTPGQVCLYSRSAGR